jgi:hypothetical protein
VSDEEEEPMTTTDPFDAVADAIVTGEVDDHLADVMNLCAQRVRQTATQVRWRLTYMGITWDEDTVTAGEIAYAERFLSDSDGRPLSYLHIAPIRYLWHRIALLVAHLHVVDGLSTEVAIEMANELTQQEQDQLLSVYESAPHRGDLGVEGVDEVLSGGL